MRRQPALTRVLSGAPGLLVALLLLGYAMGMAETLTITAPQATVREAPGVTHAVLTTVPQGSIFTIQDTQKDWYKILLDDGRTGWIIGSAGRAEGEARGLTVITPAAPTVSSPPQRLALVIGNAAYGPDIGVLQNPAHDAQDIAAALQQLGFAVTSFIDATLPQMQAAISTFSQQLRQGGVGLFYYAGHGVQVNGANYLIPIGARLKKATDVAQQAIAAERILTSMEEAANPLNLIILDACRNNPFIHMWPASQPGLAPMPAARGSLIAYATEPGALATDGTGRNGTYTKHLLQAIVMPNLPVEQMFKHVRIAVEDETQGAQIPWESSSLRGDFMFRPTSSESNGAVVADRPTPAETPPSPPPTPPASLPLAISSDEGAMMVLVPAGEFLMGSSPDDIVALLQQHRNAQRALLIDELPKHRVVLDAFYIDAYEVSNARFQRFVEVTGYRTQAERQGTGKVRIGAAWQPVPGATWRSPHGAEKDLIGLEEHPVVQVSWHDARAYCAWAGKRLPTEAEWEKAARGTDGRDYPWGNTFDGSRLNACDRHCPAKKWREPAFDDGYRITAPVDSYESGKSPYGAYNMAGNVWEWVADFYEADYYQHSPTSNPPGPASGNEVVIRGGSWLYPAPAFRVPTRAGVPPDNSNTNIGLRCAKTP